MADLLAMVDNDDVIMDMAKMKIQYIKDYHPDPEIWRRVERYNCSRTALIPLIGESFYHQMNAVVKSAESTANMSPLEGALAGIQELSQIFKVLILSARTPEETEHVMKRIKVLGLAPYINGGISTENPQYATMNPVTGKKKVDVAIHLGAQLFVDDDERHMPEQPVEGLHCLLFGKAKRVSVPTHITEARTWVDVLDYARRMVPQIYR